MHGQHCENREQQPNDAALQHDHDLDIEFFTEKDLQQPSQLEVRHAQMSCSSARGGDGAARHSNSPAGRTPVGFEEVDAASLAALLGQEASTMCDIVFCDEDSASPAGAGTLPLQNQALGNTKLLHFGSHKLLGGSAQALADCNDAVLMRVYVQLHSITWAAPLHGSYIKWGYTSNCFLSFGSCCDVQNKLLLQAQLILARNNTCSHKSCQLATLRPVSYTHLTLPTKA